MSKRERMTGRIVNVWEEPQGTVLTADAAAGATVLAVDDVSAFNSAGGEDGSGGWLQLADLALQYVGIDDDASTITLTAGLPAAVSIASEKAEVWVWNDLYGQVDTIQYAEVRPEGKRNQADNITAVVADTVDGLANGDRGGPGERCVLVRDGDEWQLVKVMGRPSKARGLKFYEDPFTVTATGAQTLRLTYEPEPHSEHLYWEGVYQKGDQWTRSGKVVTVPDTGGHLRVGDELTVEYAYRVGIADKTGYAGAILPLDPYFYYRFEDDPAATFADDESGHDNAGFYGGAPHGAGTPGLLNSGYGATLVTGQNIGPRIPDHVSGVASTNSFSVAVIVKPFDPPGNDWRGAIIGAWGSIAANHVWELSILNDVGTKGKPRFFSYRSGIELVGPSSIVGVPTLLIASLDAATGASRLRIGTAAALTGAGTFTPPTIQQAVQVGGNGTDYHYQGGIDELAYWQRALTVSEEDSIVDAWTKYKALA